MAYTLGEAAKATGKSKTSIRRALDGGRVSGAKNDLGEWEIQPVELHRVFPLVEHRHGDAAWETARPVTPDGTPVAAALEARLEAAERLLREREETITDLRRRLDGEAEERRRLTALLTGQRQASPAEPSPEALGRPQEGRLARAWRILRGKA